MSSTITARRVLRIFLESYNEIKNYWVVKLEKYKLKDNLHKYVQLIPSIGVFLQLSWITTHFLTIIGFLLYLYKGNTNWYSISSISCILTYVLVTYRQVILLLSRKSNGAIPFSTILKSENTHLLGMSILVSVSYRVWIKLITSFVYSYINLATLFMIDMYPNNGLTKALLPLYNYFEQPLLIGASIIDLSVSLVYLKEFLFNGCPIYLFIIYCMIFAVRFENSKTCQCSSKFLFNFVISVLTKYNSFEGVVNWLKVWDEFLLPNDVVVADVTETAITTGYSTETYKFDLRKRERITSLMFDSYSVVNDL